jgi:hypothetical protein
MATADVVSRAPDGGSRVPSPFTPLQSLIDERKKPRGGDIGFAESSSVGGWAVTTESGGGFAVTTESGGGFATVNGDSVSVKPGPDGLPVPVGVNGAVAPGAKFTPPLLNRIPMWALALGGYLLLSLGGLALAARRLTTPAAGER